MVTVPNSLIGQNLVTNYSVPNKVFRVETDVVVAYGENIEQIKGMIMEAVEEQDWVMKDRPIQVLLWEFRETGVLLRARCWIEDYVDTRIVVDQLNTGDLQAPVRCRSRLKDRRNGCPPPQVE